MAAPSATEDQLKLTLTQHIKASPQQVFEAWLDPDVLCRWLGPHEWVESCKTAVQEPHVGGRYQLSMNSKAVPGHKPCGSGVSGVYRTIEKYTRLAFTWIRDGENVEMLVTVQFEPQGAGTLVTLTHEGFASQEACDQHRAGWGPSLVQLAELTEPRLVLTQQIKASPKQVFEALLDPKLIGRWLGPRSMVQSCEVMAIEPRVGGAYRIKMEKRTDSPTGPGTIFVTGIFREINPPNRVVYTWMWEEQQVQSEVTFELEAHGGGTQLTLTQVGFATTQSKLGHSRGWTGSLQQLAEILQ